MASAKRKRDDDEPETATPKRLRARIQQDEPGDDDDDDDDDESEVAQTPSKRARGRLLAEAVTPRSILKKTGLNGMIATTPKSTRKLVFETPTKPAKGGTPNGTPISVRNADRSARRKSNRRLLERTMNGAESAEESEEEETLAQQILSDDDNDDDDEEQDGLDTGAADDIAVPDTPSKRARGRPKGSGTGTSPGRRRKQRSPTPPKDLPAHEEYFWQNRPGGTKTSNNTLSSHSLLNHDDYFQTMQSYEDRHAAELDFLLDLHGRALDQWIFELEEGFNICLYGYGSKRTIIERFTARLYEHLAMLAPYKGSKKTPNIIVVNGYSSGTTLKDILITVASTLTPTTTKLPNQPAPLLAHILDSLTENPPPHPIPIIINSIDSPYLRRSPTPSTLASLAAHPSINLVCTVDTPNFALLWDVGLKSQFKFLFHDATTFAPYDAEMDVVETVNELLGRSGRRIGGRDGVGFVLRSLPEKAQELFRILVTEQLAATLMGEGGDADIQETTATPRNKKVIKTKATKPSESNQGVEYRVLYHKAVQLFVCTSEVAFRGLLKEFHDHQMIESRKDAMGTEWLWVPFRQEELEGLAEDLAGDAM